MQVHRTISDKKPSIQSYHKVSLIFVGISLLLLIFVLYLSVSKAIIDIVPKERVISLEIPASVAIEVDEKDELPGYVFEKKIIRARTFSLPQEGAQPIEAKATGTVTIVNETNTDQSLVATTRLLSKDGVLFRLLDSVIVPANGQVDARIEADLPGKTGEINATQFTIPGLHETKQKNIHAVSVNPTMGGVRYIRPLRQSDIDSAMEEIKTQLMQEAKEEWQAVYDTQNFDGFSAESIIIGSKTDIPIDTETGVFTLTVDATIRALAYPKKSLQQITETHLLDRLEQGERIGRIDYDVAHLSIKTIDVNRGDAEIIIQLDGTSIIDVTHPTLQTDQFVNQTKNEVEETIRMNERVEQVEVRFIPAWLKRMPTLPDHIEVRIRSLK